MPCGTQPIFCRGRQDNDRCHRGNAQTCRRGDCKSLQPLRVASCRGTPSEESCAGQIRTKFEIDNTQVVWESHQDIRCVVLFQIRHWLLCVCKINKTRVIRLIPHTICACSLTQFSIYICPLRVSTHIYIVQYKMFLKSIFNIYMSFNSINICICR